MYNDSIILFFLLYLMNIQFFSIFCSCNSYNGTHFTCQQDNAQNPSSQASTVCEPRNSSCTSWIQKRQRIQTSNCQHLLDHRKSKRIPEKHMLHGLSRFDFDCVDHNKLWKILKEMGIPDHLTCFFKKPVCRSGSNSQNWTWNNRLVSNRKRSTSRLYIVILLI